MLAVRQAGVGSARWASQLAVGAALVGRSCPCSQGSGVPRSNSEQQQMASLWEGAGWSFMGVALYYTTVYAPACVCRVVVREACRGGSQLGVQGEALCDTAVLRDGVCALGEVLGAFWWISSSRSCRQEFVSLPDVAGLSVLVASAAA